ncbi:hypothetical protein ABZP36_024125 [Zizania latifolia]
MTKKRAAEKKSPWGSGYLVAPSSGVWRHSRRSVMVGKAAKMVSMWWFHATTGKARGERGKGKEKKPFCIDLIDSLERRKRRARRRHRRHV